MGLPVYNQENLRVERYYYTGSQTLRKGQPMCFQKTPASSTKGFPFDVELPSASTSDTTSNTFGFAGVVAESSDGLVGPGYVNVIVPAEGDVVQVLVSNLADVAIGDFLKINGDSSGSTVTATGSPQWTAGGMNQGFMDKATLDAGTIAVSQSGCVALAAAIVQISSAMRIIKARALETISSQTANTTATTATGGAAAGGTLGPGRALIWCQFRR